VKYDFIIKATNTTLMLAHECRFKAAITVSWSGDFKIARVTADCLFSVPIALVWLVCFLMLGVAEMVFHLSFKGSIDKRLHELLLKVFDVIEAFHATSHLLSQFLDVRLVSHCLFSCYWIISSYTVFRKLSKLLEGKPLRIG